MMSFALAIVLQRKTRTQFCESWSSAKTILLVAVLAFCIFFAQSAYAISVVATVTVGSSPDGVAYDSGKGEIFVVNEATPGIVSVISDSTNKVTATVTVGGGPVGVAYDSGQQEIFVTNSARTVSVISDPIIPSAQSHDDSVYNPPSIGNDYHQNYGGGITINGKPFDIENYATTIPAQVLQIGKPATFDFKIYDERGGYTISHVGMYFHFKGDPAVTNADTWISWDKYHGFDTHDPNKIFSKTSVDVKPEDKFFHVTFTMTPQKPMPDSSLIMRMWDDKLATGDVPIWGAIVIVDPNAPVPVKKIPTNQYSDYVILENLLDKDGYYIPILLNKLHDLREIYSSLDINWIYDKGANKLTLVESDKTGNLVGEVVSNLDKKVPQPTITDHDYVFIAQQLNRQDQASEGYAMIKEAQKTEKILQSIQVIGVDYQPNIQLSAAANSILEAWKDDKSSKLYVYDSVNQDVKKIENLQAEKILESMCAIPKVSIDACVVQR